MNVVLPDSINAQITVRLKGVPWQRAFQAVLEANGLWYRYRDNGHLIRIAPRKVLDAENDAEFARSAHR
jgi:type II secretory pathway component HofQ